MESFDLDDEIERIRQKSWEQSSLEKSGQHTDVLIDTILSEIKMLARTIEPKSIKTHDKRQNRKKINYETRKAGLLYKLDHFISKNKFYRKHIRPRLKGLLPNMNSRITVSVVDLLKHEDAAFIDVVYRSLLCREPDIEGKTHHLELLRSGSMRKIDIISHILHSPEGQRKYISVKGLSAHLLKDKILNKLYFIPVFGYIIRWGICLLLLPKKLNSLYLSLSNNRSQTEQDHIQLILLEQKVHQLEKTQDELSGVIELLRTECDRQFRFHNIDSQTMNRLYFNYKNKLMNNDREEIKTKLAPYIISMDKWLSDRNRSDLKIVDLGCGLGEWLEVLGENGYSAFGVDSNDLTVQQAMHLNRQINIEFDDAFTFLHKQKECSFDVISSFHMIEHLDLFELFTLFDECKRVLKPEGLLILVTPNPQNIILSTYLFHLDPTHRSPIPVELLKFYMEEWGFQVFETIFLNPYHFFDYDYNTDDPLKNIAFRFNLAQEYGVMAVKVK